MLFLILLPTILTIENFLHHLYKSSVCQISTETKPQTYLQDAKYDHWQQAIAEELQAMGANKMWTVVQLPLDRESVGCRWIYKIKRKADGSIENYKARLVSKSFTQQTGLDFTGTFSPVAKVTSVRVIFP